MDVLNDIRSCEVQDVWVALDVAGMVSEALAAIIGVGEASSLDRRAVGAIEDEDALRQQRVETAANVPHAETLPAVDGRDQRRRFTRYAAAFAAETENTRCPGRRSTIS